MLLDINVFKLIYTCIFLLVFLVCYFVVLQTNLERLFKQGSIWAIRIGQVLVSLGLAYLVTKGIMSLIESTQFF